jgi:hypothetical protein
MQVNPWAVIAAALVNFVIGGLWYSPMLFGKPWMKANGFTEADLERGSPAVIFGASFVLCLLMAGNLAAFLGDPSVDLGFAVAASAAAGLGWAAFGLAVVALFERRGLTYILVNGGYLTVSFVAMGLILGAWR